VGGQALSLWYDPTTHRHLLLPFSLHVFQVTASNPASRLFSTETAATWKFEQVRECVLKDLGTYLGLVIGEI